MGSAHRSRGVGPLRLVAAVFLSTVPSALSAQVLTIHLVDESSGTPVNGALVTLVDSDGSTVWSGVSNSDGRLRLTPPEAGEYYIEANRLGYDRYRSPLLALKAEGALNLEIPMRASPVGLEGMEIVGEQARASLLESLGLSEAELGDRWIDRSEIEAMGVSGGPKDLIRRQNIPGLWIDEAAAHARTPVLCLTLRGRAGCAITVLDGALIQPSVAHHLDPATLEAVAILRPREAAILYGTRGGNGAVLFWTRAGAPR